MTVRLTPTESDSTPAHLEPDPPRSADAIAPAPVVVTDGATIAHDAPTTAPEVPSDPGEHVANDSRPALREARRQRRRTAWLCAAVLAICLALTIVVVSLARTRTVPTSGTVSAVSAISHPASGSLLSADPHLGAPAPEGGTR